MCSEPTKTARGRKRIARPLGEERPAADRELELGAVRLHSEWRAGRGGHGAAGQHVVREDEVGGELGADRRGVRLDVRRPLRIAEVLQVARLKPFVAVEHEDREQAAADVRPDDARAAQVELLRVRLLAEHDDLVPVRAPGSRERARVDVRAGAREQVAVPEDDVHGADDRRSSGRGTSALPVLPIAERLPCGPLLEDL
jgi:hypothetical protein